MHPDNWASDDPVWRRGSFNFVDFFFGRTKYTREIWTEGICQLQMPEGVYAVKYKGCHDTWKRPRWKAIMVNRFDFDLEKGLPIPGKGENSWDLGEDAIFGGTYPADTLDEALKRLAASANRDRQRYGGSNWQPKHD